MFVPSRKALQAPPRAVRPQSPSHSFLPLPLRGCVLASGANRRARADTSLSLADTSRRAICRSAPERARAPRRKRASRRPATMSQAREREAFGSVCVSLVRPIYELL